VAVHFSLGHVYVQEIKLFQCESIGVIHVIEKQDFSKTPGLSAELSGNNSRTLKVRTKDNALFVCRECGCIMAHSWSRLYGSTVLYKPMAKVMQEPRF